MAGTHDITQTRACYVCQSITSTGLGESELNALETISVRSIADGSLALIAPTGQVFRWDDTSLLPPGPATILPWGQSLIMLGRWLLVAPGPNPVDIFYNFFEALPLADTLTPEYGALEAALQQSTLRVVNGNLSDHGQPPNGYTELTLHNQQVFYLPLAGPVLSMVQRARLRFVSDLLNPGLEPVIVTDDPATDSTVVTVYSKVGGSAAFAPYSASLVTQAIASLAQNTRIRMNAVGACNVTLPAAGNITDQIVIWAVDVGGNAALNTYKLTAGAGTTIEGSAAFTLTTNHQKIFFAYNLDTLNWE